MERIFIGVAWPYANGSLHLGHIAGSLLPPDIFARYHRLKGNEVLMVSGSDEHGTPITLAAERHNKSPQEIADHYHDEHVRSLEGLGISFDLFTRTSIPEHKAVVQDVFLKLLGCDYIYKQEVVGLYCANCDRWLPDRYVEGTCPYCEFEGTRGDQCESCGKTLDVTELLAPECKLCGNAPEQRTTEHFFLKLSVFKDRLISYVEPKTFWKGNVYKFTMNWLKELRDRPITRNLEWGVEVPLDGFEDKRIYVWFDAVIGYLSASKQWAQRNNGDWERFWKDDATRHYYFIGKDNIPFHTMIWPAMLMGYGGLNLPYDVPANEFLTLRGKDFSKSRGIGFRVPDYLDRYDPDAIRYYLAINMPENRDVDFAFDDFIEKNNKELVGTLGNFVHRVLMFTFKNLGRVPQGELEAEVCAKINDAYETVSASIENCRFKPAIQAVMALAQYGNIYLNEHQPWHLIKTDKAACAQVLYNSLRLVKALSVLMMPFLPFAGEKLQRQLGFAHLSWADGKTDLKPIRLSKPQPLFEKLEPEQAREVAIDFERFDLRVGTVSNVEPHAEADKLYVLRVDVGEEITLIAGLKEHYTADALVGKRLIVLTNLEPRKFKNVLSQGMLLAAEADKTVAVLTIDEHVKNGARAGVRDMNVAESSERMSISMKEFADVDMRAGLVKAVRRDGEQLILDVDAGQPLAVRTAGLSAEASELLGKKVVVVTNSEPPGILRVNDALVFPDKAIKTGAQVR